MIKSAIQFVLKHRLAVILAMSLVSVLLGLQIRNLQIVIDSNAMQPNEHPNVVASRLAEALFGSRNVVLIGVSAADGGSVYRKNVMEVVARLSDRVKKLPGVKAHTLMSVTAERAKAISGADDTLQVEPMLALPVTEAGVAQLPARLANNPLYENLLVAHDGSLASISFSITNGKAGFREVLDRVDAALAQEANPAVRLSLSGPPVFYANVERYAQRMGLLFPLALLLIGLIHFEAFRTFQGMILPLLTALMAVVWGLGVMGWAGVPMDAFNSTTPILILAVAAGHAVQILKRFYEEFARLATASPSAAARTHVDGAIIDAMVKVAPVMIMAGLVAAMGFFSLVTFDIATIRTFGIFTGIGILSALVIELSFIPALRSYLPAPALRKAGQAVDGEKWDRFAGALTRLVLRRHKQILLGAMLLVLLSTLGMMALSHENSTKSYFGATQPVRVQDRFLNEKLAGTNTLYVVLRSVRPDRMKDPAILRLVEQTQRYIETLPEVGKTASIVDLLQQMHRSMNSDLPAAAKGPASLPDSAALISQYLLLYSMSGAPTDFDAYIDYQYDSACITVWTKSDSSKYAGQMVALIRGYLQSRLPADIEVHVGGSVSMAAALSETLVASKLKNILQMILVVLVAGALAFRSLKTGLFLVVPLLVTVMVNFGVMGATGIPLNTPNSVSSALGIGIGADYAIYLIYRMGEEMRRAGGVFDVALEETMKTAGKAVIYVASAIVGGYAVLMLSVGFYVHIWFGILIVLSMIVSAASALLLVPSLMKLCQPTPAYTPAKVYGVAPLYGALLAAGLALAVSLCGSDARAAAQDGAESLMEKSYQAVRVNSSVSEATFRLVNASGQERLRKTSGATKLSADGADNRRLIRFLAPGDVRNTATLMTEHQAGDDEIWIYLPAMKKARRLASNGKKGSFVGTDLAYGDMVGHKTADWSHRLLPPGAGDSQQGQACTVIESLPKNAVVAEDSGYAKRVSWLSKETNLPLRVDFYDQGGTLLKTAISSDWKLVDAQRQKWAAMSVSVKNAQTGHTTFVQIEKFQANVELGDSLFSVRALEKEE